MAVNKQVPVPVQQDLVNVVNAVQRWYDEKYDYDYDKLTCTPGETCGHYTSVVWATTRQVGCAYHYCDTMEHESFTIVDFLACNYVPMRNLPGEKPFKKGRPCSKCASGAGWCNNGLCNSGCSKAGVDCSCQAICHNSSTLNLTTCRCSCADGWYGTDCSEPCEDRNDHRDPSPGTSGPAARLTNDDIGPDGSEGDDDDDDHNCSQHQQQCCAATLLSYVILALTITRIALLRCTYTSSGSGMAYMQGVPERNWQRFCN